MKKIMGLILILIYFGYVYYVWLSVNFEDFWVFVNWRFFQKLFLVVFPLYIFLFLKYWNRIISIDYHAIYIPFLFWFFLLCLGLGKSDMNVFIVNPPIVGIICGIYLLREPLSKIKRCSNIPAESIAKYLLSTEIVLILLQQVLIPGLPS